MSVKFDQRIYQENLILKKVLQVTVISQQDSNDPLASLISNSSVTLLQQACRELLKFPQIKSMLEKKTLFDTIFSDILSQQNKYGFALLLDCYSNNILEMDKVVNKDF